MDGKNSTIPFSLQNSLTLMNWIGYQIGQQFSIDIKTDGDGSAVVRTGDATNVLEILIDINIYGDVFRIWLFLKRRDSVKGENTNRIEMFGTTRN